MDWLGNIASATGLPGVGKDKDKEQAQPQPQQPSLPQASASPATQGAPDASNKGPLDLRQMDRAGLMTVCCLVL